jgi:two-component system response regulator FlrC
VVAVSSAEAALLQTGHAAQTAQPFAIVVSDLILGGMDGAALLTRLSREAPATRVLLMSGFADEARRRATETQPYAVLLKPFAPGELLQRIRESLDGATVE